MIPPTYERPLTWRLMFLVISLSFGCWFALGYAFTSTNAPENLMLHWIRQVKCRRNGGAAVNLTYTNASLDVWCREIPLDEETLNLKDNPELNTILAVIGTMLGLGAFCAAWVSNTLIARFGERGTVLLTSLLVLIGAALGGFCVMMDSYEAMIVSRFVLGAHTGIVLAVVPMYITEISPPHLRGMLSAIPGLLMFAGSLVSVVLGIPELFGSEHLWPLIFGLIAIPGIVVFLTIPFCPESPRYLLLVRNDKVAAEKALVWLRGTRDVFDELSGIHEEGQTKDTSHQVISVIGLFTDRFLRKVTLITIVLLLNNQLSGVSGIAIYSTSFFQRAGLRMDEAVYGTIALMSVPLVATGLNVVLLDRLGRRFLLLAGSALSILCLLILMTLMALERSELCDGCRYGNVAGLIVFMLVFMLGPGSIHWLIVSEMYTQSSRGAAMMVASAVNNGAAILMTFIFPILQAQIDQWTFAIFAGIMMCCTTFLAMRVIETKGKDLNMIHEELHAKLM